MSSGDKREPTIHEDGPLRTIEAYHKALNHVCGLFFRGNEDLSCFDEAFDAMAEGLVELGRYSRADRLLITVAFADRVDERFRFKASEAE